MNNFPEICKYLFDQKGYKAICNSGSQYKKNMKKLQCLCRYD